MGFIAWIIFGTLAGWVASKLTGVDDRMGCVSNVLIGIAGAFIGGMLYKLITDERWDSRFNLPSFVVAVLGSVLLLALLRRVRV